ncbi:hypothetical protein [Nocardioides aquiterrae]|uniref:Uncharacterized protein n=1 Tax=Nocardioides aquiterrae TaxID=203799 RepID=A0ABN1UB63_9ACTN
MSDPQTSRYKAVGLVVLGIIVVVLLAYLVVAWAAGGDDTGEIDPQNGDSAPVLVR